MDRCFIIGGGPSVADITEAQKKKLNKEIIFGCNKAAFNFDCDHVIVHDPRFIKRYQKDIEKLRGVKHIPLKSILEKTDHKYQRFQGMKFPECGDCYNQHPKKRVGSACDKCNNNKAESDISDAYMGSNVGTTALSIAYLLGFKEIYLLGYDLRYALKESEVDKLNNMIHNSIKELDAELTKEEITKLGYNYEFKGVKSHYHEGYPEFKKIKPPTQEGTFGHMIHFTNILGEYIKKSSDVKIFNCSDISIIDPDESWSKRIDLSEVLND
jgi:hypothetical protein